MMVSRGTTFCFVERRMVTAEVVWCQCMVRRARVAAPSFMTVHYDDNDMTLVGTLGDPCGARWHSPEECHVPGSEFAQWMRASVPGIT